MTSELSHPSADAADQVTRDDVLCVVGGGYVGLVTAACLAEMGNSVRLLETDPLRLEVLREGRAPIFEPGLEDLLRTVIDAGRFEATDDARAAVSGAGMVFIAVGTPPRADGTADLSQVRTAVDDVSATAADSTVLVIKSTVPPGTTVSLRGARPDGRPPLVTIACPEFLREGSALEDFRKPPRVVVGGRDVAARSRVGALFEPLGTRVLFTDATSAELVKYGSNAFLALKISFINEMANICELTGGDITAVSDGIGSDPRIGSAFLRAGLGFGGSCFPKDLRALDEAASYHGHSFWLLKAAIEVNRVQRHRFVARITEALNGTTGETRVAVLGLAFKPGTDDMRQAASVDVIRQLLDLGHNVTACDPVATEAAAALLPGIVLTHDPYVCVAGADVVALVTEWPEYRALDWERVASLARGRVVVDGRNCLDATVLRDAGFRYVGMGRPGG
jgi:UDPglucose 6-dehydrogenase